MPTPEQIAALVAPLVVPPVVQLITEAIKQMLIEERSLLTSNLINKVNSHLTETLKLYFEELIANQKQEFELELQTKIDELKFQHYQQLERLGQAVEDVITFNPNDETLEEILDETEEIIDEINEFDEFNRVFEQEIEKELVSVLSSDLLFINKNDFNLESDSLESDSLESDSSKTETERIFEQVFNTDEWEDISSDLSDPFTDFSNQELMSEGDRYQLNLNAEVEIEDAPIQDEQFTSYKLDFFTVDDSEDEFSQFIPEVFSADTLEITPEIAEPSNISAPFALMPTDPPSQVDQGIVLSEADLSLEDFEFDRPEIIYEGEGYEFGAEPTENLHMDDELNRELSELIDGDLFSLESESELERELESELLAQFPMQSLPEIQDDELSKFADLETESDFWSADRDGDLSSTKNVWHLGIDFGYSAIRVCLFNQVTERVYSLNFDGKEAIATNIEINYGGEAIAIQGFKQFLRIGIPYRLQNHWQPTLPWTKDHTLNLKDFQISAQGLLAQIESASHPQLSDISNIMSTLETVILGHPHSWSDAYIFNLKEAVLGSGLVDNIERILIIDQAIALLFPPLHDSEHESKKVQLVLDGGAFTTTLGFNFNHNLEKPRFSDLEYAGLGINQDIILQLLYPKTKDKLPATKFIVSGTSNPEYRTGLQQFLLKSAIGIEALAIAEQIKLFFSEQPTVSLWEGNLGGKFLKISRSELEVKVIQPFIQSLNDAINRLISGYQPEDITHIAVSGGTMRLPSVGQWLEAKFANAQVLGLPDSNLARGLAIAPKYSEYLDINRHQYSDYFLLSEICNLNLQEPLNLETLSKKLQNRGVNPKACSDRLARILSGQLPQGILPWQEPEKSIILADPYLDPQILATNLFTPLHDRLFMPNPIYTQLLGAYLKMLSSHTQQSFSEPLVFPSFVI